VTWKRAPRLIVERGAMPSFSWDGESFVYAVGAVANQHLMRVHVESGEVENPWFTPPA
jgi:hypothetical protein